MFKNILVPTDGSELARKAARLAVQVAKATGATITGFHVAPTYKFHIDEEYVPPNFMLPNEYRARVKEVAERHLDVIRKMADAAGVSVEGEYVLNDFPEDAILAAVKKFRCDSIFMGTHARSAIVRLFVGSVTQRVLTKATVPVTVTH
jgi:nucleotide-binding universal stress UspA family protein